MEKDYEHKGVKITFDDSRARFNFDINGRRCTSTSLDGAKRQIEKYAVEAFTPVDVLILSNVNGKQKLTQERIASYKERYGSYRNSRELIRYFVTEKGEEISINGSYSHYNRRRVFPVSKLAEVESLLKQEEQQQKIQRAADQKERELQEKLKNLSFDLSTIDPKASQ